MERGQFPNPRTLGDDTEDATEGWGFKEALLLLILRGDKGGGGTIVWDRRAMSSSRRCIQSRMVSRAVDGGNFEEERRR